MAPLFPDPQRGEDPRAARRIVEASDAARRRLARDLHDGAQQQIVVTVINLQRAQQKWAADPSSAKQLLDAGLESAQLGLDSLRELAAGIDPPLLAAHGLRAAVDDLAGHLPIPCASQVMARRLDAGIEASLYFFVAEALANVMKHSGAKRANVLISDEGAQFVVEVRDDGVGGATVIDGGTGLLGLADRIGALGGELTVTSPPGDGTVLRALVPAPAEAA